MSRRPRHMDPFHGWHQTMSADEARALADEKRGQGLAVRLTIKPPTQGIQIHPHRVAWWVPSPKAKR